MNLDNKDNFVPTQQTSESRSRRMLHVAAVLLLLSFLLFLCQLINLGIFNAGASGPDSLPVSIRANSQADYSRDEQALFIPPINGNILRQIILDMTATGSPEDRFATLEAILSSPVPTMTPNYLFPTTPAPTKTIAPTPTRTLFPTISKTQTPTKFITPTKTPIPTRTFIPTYTVIRTPTPTEANPIDIPNTEVVLPTETYTPTPTSTPTDTPTPTPTDTPTPTPTDTPTPTPTDTSTPTPTSTPVCMLMSGGISLSGKNLEIAITNNDGALVTISSINVDWPNVPDAQSISEIKFNGVTIVFADDPLPPSDYPSEKSWAGTQSDLQLEAFASKQLVLLFTEDLQPSGYSITVTFENGCTVSESN